jgi:hypothetical protein
LIFGLLRRFGDHVIGRTLLAFRARRSESEDEESSEQETEETKGKERWLVIHNYSRRLWLYRSGVGKLVKSESPVVNKPDKTEWEIANLLG